MVIKNFLTPADLSPVFQEINTLVALQLDSSTPHPVVPKSQIDSSNLIELFQKNRPALGAVYRSLRHCKALQRLNLDQRFEELYRLLEPDVGMVNISPYTASRLDFQGEEKYLFDYHQDYHYIQLSQNSIVYWIPLSPLDTDGAVEILERSHKDGLRRARMLDSENQNKNGAFTLSIRDDVEVSKYTSVAPQLSVGDVLVFSTLTIHRSLPQVEHFFRVSTQFRMGDFNNLESIKRGWPVGQLEGRPFHIDHPEYVDV